MVLEKLELLFSQLVIVILMIPISENSYLSFCYFLLIAPLSYILIVCIEIDDIQRIIIHLQMHCSNNVINTWNKILNHTFLIEISTNALPIDKFVFYLKQDRIFLIEFCSLFQAVKQKFHDYVHLAELFYKPFRTN